MTELSDSMNAIMARLQPHIKEGGNPSHFNAICGEIDRWAKQQAERATPSQPTQDVEEAVEKLCPKPEHPGPQKAAHSQDIYETAVEEYHKDLVLWEASKRRVTKLLLSLCQPDTVEIVWEDIRKAIDAIPVPDFIDPPGNGAIAGLIKHKVNEILKQAEKDAERVAAEISTDTPPIGVDEAVDKICGEKAPDNCPDGLWLKRREEVQAILTSLLASKPDVKPLDTEKDG